MSQIYLVDINFYMFTFPPPPILCSVLIVIIINIICCTQSLIIIMVNTNCRNPNAPSQLVEVPERLESVVCGKFGHDSECCWLLEKSEDTQQVVVNTFPIQADIDDNGKEASD